MSGLRIFTIILLTILFSPVYLFADTTTFQAYTWDDAGGLTASVSAAHDNVTISGTRVSQTAWGLGPVNYMAGATSEQRLAGNGTLEIDVVGTGPGGAFGDGSGYKAIVQFWNDTENYIALGIINDPGVSPDGVTVMVEGASYGNRSAVTG